MSRAALTDHLTAIIGERLWAVLEQERVSTAVRARPR